MAHALQLAERGLWTTHPNPRVGCVLANDGQIVGEGWHRHAGGPHAEIYALREAGDLARGATAYVTLEPCHHQGRTPPCRQALIDAGVSEVVVAVEDPFPKVAGKGLSALAAAGITVRTGLMADQARELNAGFFSRQQRQRPLVRLKLAASADGRTALANGRSQWITGDEARADVQRWRARASAVLTGGATVRADNPRLTARVDGLERAPLRVVLSQYFNVRPTAKLFDQEGPCLIVGSGPPPVSLGERAVALADSGPLDLQQVLGWLATEHEVNELHVECGPRLAGQLLAAALVDELLLYLAPSVLGDSGRGMFGLPALETMAERINLKWLDVRQIGADLRLRARPLSTE